WINVDGVHDTDFLKEFHSLYNLHPIVQEDITNTTQRPKVEEYDNGVYLVLRMLSYDVEKKEINTEQVSLFLGAGYVLTYQERTEDVFDPIRQRIQLNQGRLRKTKADYLFYALLDTIVRNYYSVLEGIEDQIDEIEDRIYEDNAREVIQEIQKLKKVLIFLRKSIFPLREVINQIERTHDHAFIQQKTLLFFRDLQDQMFQITDLIESFRDTLSNLHDLHLALNGHKMNQVMKLLTIISTIFIPLTFIVGVYGMNFKHMPELDWQNGYFMVLGIMGLLTVLLIWFFKRKDWF
ncbi:MAG: magnesium/cobalt transporter CorA, partial [Bacteroidota bacterium]